MKAEKTAQDRDRVVQALLVLLSELLEQQLSPAFYQHVLDRAVALIPGAQAGSITLRDERGEFRFVAARGFGLTALQEVSFSYEEAMLLFPSDKERSYLVEDLASLGARMLDAERYQILCEAGRIEAIRATLMVPIRVGGEITATLLLDNFDDPQAFAPEARARAELFGCVVGLVLQRLQLEARTEGLLLEFRRLMQRSFVATVVFEPSGAVADCNESFVELTGIARQELIGCPSIALHAVMDGGWLGEALASLEQQGIGTCSEIAVRTKTGESLCCLAALEAFTLDHSKRAVLSLIDITERKRNEEELLQALQSAMGDTSWFITALMERLLQASADESAADTVAALSARERQLLGHLAQGRSNAQIATAMGLSKATVRNYLSRVYDKLGVSSRAEAIVWARQRGLMAGTASSDSGA